MTEIRNDHGTILIQLGNAILGQAPIDATAFMGVSLSDIRAAIANTAGPASSGAAPTLDVQNERDFLAQEARRYASHYPEASDGRNTFIIFAEMIERRASLNGGSDAP